TFIPYLKDLTAKRKKPPFKHFDEFDRRLGMEVSLLKYLFPIPDFKNKETRESRTFQREMVTRFRDELKLMNLISGETRTDSALSYHMQNTRSLVEEHIPVEGSLISMRPLTGEITSVIGGSDFVSSNQLLRHVSSRRQPGSSFKPILYAAAIEFTNRVMDPGNSLTAASLVDDSPIQFVGQDLTEYSPENYSGGYAGPVRIRKALELSKNAVAVRVYEKMGSRNITPIMQDILSLKSRTLPREASVALGTFGLTTYEMARAYSVLASGGKETRPYLIRYITNSEGKILADYRSNHEKNRQILSPETVSIVSDMMKDVVRSGTGRAAYLSGRDVAGKTGTTNRNTDAWFVGFTGNLVTAVHIGHDIVRSLGRNSTGGSIAAPVWGKYMYRALRNEKNVTIPVSDKVKKIQICEISGKLPSEGCSSKITELFYPGTEPVELCNDHEGSVQEKTPLIKKKEDIFTDEDFK
ncbi:MAG: penicillin-binding transpeptidase domain-containing protein, partial [Spirochaetia bacterium]|nr:penicillin-binding transpeptidase domain-containing protein [Spirochaetia bacterium]